MLGNYHVDSVHRWKRRMKKISKHDAYLFFSSPDRKVRDMLHSTLIATMQEIEKIDNNAVSLYAGECHPGIWYKDCAKLKCKIWSGTKLSDVFKKCVADLKRGKKKGHVMLFRTLPELTPRPELGIALWCTYAWTKAEHLIDPGGRPLGFNVFDRSTKKRLGLI